MPGFPRLKDEYDLVVVGGGHAGLQAALKGALLRQRVALIDRGPKYSRSYYAPKMDNIPGFPEGISGHKLLDLQIGAVRKLSEWVDYFSPAVVGGVERTDGGFAASFDWLKQSLVARGRVLLLAMGVVDRILEVGGSIQPIFPWANQALVSFCIVCDGHDFSGKSVAVLGHDAFAARSVLDVLDFAPRSVEVLTHGHRPFEGVPESERAQLEPLLEARSIPWREQVIVGFEEIREKRFGVTFADGARRSYDRGFSALGWYDMHATLPRTLGCVFDEEGYVRADEECRAVDPEGRPIPGLYAVGDLRTGWNQIPAAWASAERAVLHAWTDYL